MATISQRLTDKPAEGGSRAWRFLKRELAPFPGRMDASIRIAIAAVIVTALAETGRSEALFLALFVLVTLPRDFPRQTWTATVQILVCVWSSTLAALILDALVADIRWLRVLVIGFSIFFCLIIGRGLKRPLVGILSAITVTVPLLQWDTSVEATTNVEFVLWIALMLSTGVLVATGVEYLYSRASPLERVISGMAEQLDSVRAVLKKADGEQLTAEEERRAQEIQKLAVAGTGSLQQFLPAVSSSHLLDEDYLIRLTSVLMGIELLVALAARLDRFSPACFDEKERSQLPRLCTDIGQLAASIRQQDTSHPENRPEEEVNDSGDDHAVSVLLAHMAFVLGRLWNTWHSEAFFVGESARRGIRPPESQKISIGPFFTPDNVHFAFKTAVASMICYAIYTGVDWPGISTSLLTCFIVALDTVGATFRKLALRLAGVAIGGLLFGIGGISLVISNMTNVVELLLVVAVVFFISGWVVKGSQRISYAGVQIGLSFALVALNGPTIPDQIVEARDRFVGVLLGAIVMWFTFRQLWPVNAIADQRSKIGSLLRQSGELATLAGEDLATEEKVRQMRKIRVAANQAIFQANEEADAAGFDSHYDAAIQQSLRDCLRRAESLLLLGLIDAGSSVNHPQSQIPEAIRSALKTVTKQYTSCLHSLADEIQDSRLAGATQQCFRENEFGGQAEEISELLQSLRLAEDPSMRRYASIQARILQRRGEFTRQMREAVTALSSASRGSQKLVTSGEKLP
jgi:multidrug resistance protein MdtO